MDGGEVSDETPKVYLVMGILPGGMQPETLLSVHASQASAGKEKLRVAQEHPHKFELVIVRVADVMP